MINLLSINNGIISSNTRGYLNGLYGKRYVGYFNDNVNWFSTAALHGDVNQLTEMNEFKSSAGSYSWEWLGYFRASTTENYTFYTTSDDASYLWIGDKAKVSFTTANATVNNGGLHGVVEATSSPVSLVAGSYYPIRIQFGQNTGGDQISVSFTTPTITRINTGPTYYSNGLGYFYYNKKTNNF